MRRSFLSGVLWGLLAVLVVARALDAVLPDVPPAAPPPATAQGRSVGPAATPAPATTDVVPTGTATTTTPAPPDPPAAEAAIVLDVLTRAERDPSILAMLDAMGHPVASAWRAFFVHAGYGPVPDDPPVRVRHLRAKALAALPTRLHTFFETPWTAAPPPALVSSLRFARDVASGTDGDDAIPCWIAARWTEAWVAAYATRLGATDDDGLPACTLPPTLRAAQEAWDARVRRHYETTYDSTPVCNGYGAAQMHRRDVRSVQALYDPRGFDRDVPDVAALSRAQHDDTTRSIYDLWSPRRLDPAALERMWRVMDAPAAWHRAVVTHYTRTLRLPPAEAQRRARTLATYRRAAFLEAADGCRWVSEPT